MRDECHGEAPPREEVYDVARDPSEYEYLAGNAEETGDLPRKERSPANPRLVPGEEG
ncbi:MAG: hypothetical protein ACOCX2_05330 [Armatimonadota bacterium]